MSTDLLERDRPGFAAGPIDPRLAARRREVARGTGRRRRRRLTGAALAVALLALAVAATRSPLLDVDDLEVHGAPNTGSQAVADALGIEPGDALVSVDTAAAAARVEALPWVADAAVERSWTGRITVVVQERTAVAIVGTGRQARLLDASGRVLGPAAPATNLPGVAGAAPEVGERLASGRRPVVATLAELPRDLATQVAEASSGPGGITLVLADGITVAWGTGGRTAAKAQALRLLFAQAGRATIDRVDVSVPSAPALTRRSGGGA